MAEGAVDRIQTFPPFRGSRIAHALRRRLHTRRANTRTGSRRNIAAHYDLGHAFYRTWLDDSMTYSSAVYAAEDTPLAAAQDEKYGRILAMVNAQPGQHKQVIAQFTLERDGEPMLSSIAGGGILRVDFRIRRLFSYITAASATSPRRSSASP